jgi:hypothetical protein
MLAKTEYENSAQHIYDIHKAREKYWANNALIRTPDHNFVAYYISISGPVLQSFYVTNALDRKFWLNKLCVTFKITENSRRLLGHHCPKKVIDNLVGIFFPALGEKLYIDGRLLKDPQPTINEILGDT